MTKRSMDYERYVEACNYPGTLDEAAVKDALTRYCAALGIKREIVRIEAGWRVEDYPDMALTVGEILGERSVEPEGKP